MTELAVDSVVYLRLLDKSAVSQVCGRVFEPSSSIQRRLYGLERLLYSNCAEETAESLQRATS